MTKKDFEAIAHVLSCCKPPTAESDGDWDFGRVDNWHTVCEGFASHLATTNPRFDRSRFLEACGAKE